MILAFVIPMDFLLDDAILQIDRSALITANKLKAHRAEWLSHRVAVVVEIGDRRHNGGTGIGTTCGAEAVLAEVHGPHNILSVLHNASSQDRLANLNFCRALPSRAAAGALRRTLKK